MLCMIYRDSIENAVWKHDDKHGLSLFPRNLTLEWVRSLAALPSDGEGRTGTAAGDRAGESDT